MKHTMQRYVGPQDQQRLIEFRQRYTIPENAADYPTASDLRELLDPAATGPRDNVCLWEDTDRNIIAFAIAHLPYNNLYFQIAPQAQNNDIETQIINWGSEHIRAYAKVHGKSMVLDTPCRDTNTERIACLKRHGFVQSEDATLHMERSLAESLPTAQLPTGFTLRHVAGTHEVEEYVAMHRDAFGTENMTVEHRLSIMRNLDYRPELDLIAVAPGGTFAAFCICNINPELNARARRNEGEIAVIGTRRAYRGQGLGRAMLLAGLQQLKAHGMTIATLGTASGNKDAQRLYESVGFRTTCKYLWFSKKL
jgi:mycothiol synthase